ncbi:DUF3283 family protein [Aeromonas aquatilis]
MALDLARLPEQERQKVELDKQAAWLVWLCRRHLATRDDVAKAITRQPEEYRTYFLERLNYYREVKGSHEQVY